MAETKSDRSAWWLALVGALGAVTGAAITGGFNYFDHQRDLDAKMIELSIGILRAEPSAETKPLREWAIDVMDKRAGFSFNASQQTVLLERQLPFKGGSYTDIICYWDAKTGLYSNCASGGAPTSNAPK